MDQSQNLGSTTHFLDPIPTEYCTLWKYMLTLLSIPFNFSCSSAMVDGGWNTLPSLQIFTSPLQYDAISYIFQLIHNLLV